jgi:hypothetical protein
MFPITVTVTITPILILAILLYDLLLVTGVVWLVRRYRRRAATRAVSASVALHAKVPLGSLHYPPGSTTLV